MVELDDFSSGTSSRSTKLLHGGVRYLQKAIFQLDIDQYRMVKEALYERSNLLDIAPHLSYPLPIVSCLDSCNNTKTKSVNDYLKIILDAPSLQVVASSLLLGRNQK